MVELCVCSIPIRFVYKVAAGGVNAENEVITNISHRTFEDRKCQYSRGGEI